MSPILIMYHTVPLPGWVIWIFVSTLPYRGFSARVVSPLLTHWRYCSFALSHRNHIHDQTVENLRSLWHKLILPWHCEAHQHSKQSPIWFKLHAYKCKIINEIMKPNLYIPTFVEFAFFFQSYILVPADPRNNDKIYQVTAKWSHYRVNLK